MPARVNEAWQRNTGTFGQFATLPWSSLLVIAVLISTQSLRLQLSGKELAGNCLALSRSVQLFFEAAVLPI